MLRLCLRDDWPVWHSESLVEGRLCEPHIPVFLAIGFLAFIILNYYGSLRAEDKYSGGLALYLPDVASFTHRSYTVLYVVLSHGQAGRTGVVHDYVR